MDLRGKRVLIMGLGLQGSGMAAARYAAQQGAIVRVTDLKSPEILAPSVRALSGLSQCSRGRDAFIVAADHSRNTGRPGTFKLAARRAGSS